MILGFNKSISNYTLGFFMALTTFPNPLGGNSIFSLAGQAWGKEIWIFTHCRILCMEVFTASKGLASFFFCLFWVGYFLLFPQSGMHQITSHNSRIIIHLSYWRLVGTLFSGAQCSGFSWKEGKCFHFSNFFKAFLDTETGRNCLFIWVFDLAWNALAGIALC